MEKFILKNVITAVPGIGTKYAARLDAAGIKKVSRCVDFLSNYLYSKLILEKAKKFN